MAFATYQWLTSKEGQSWLERASKSDQPLHSQVATLRKDLTAEQARLVVEQIQLRNRATGRFANAAQMFFTDKGLQQATDSVIARYKASRFGSGPVVDLCCGIGGDLVALAARGATTGLDSNPTCVALANATLAALGASECTAIVGDVTDLSVLPHCAIHVDPDRRPSGRRSVQIENHSPSTAELQAWIEHPAGTAIKLAPATEAEHPLFENAELEWIGHHRACQQLVAWYGPLRQRAGKRVATTLSSNGSAHSLEQSSDDNNFDLEMASAVGDVLVEPTAAVLAAGLAPEIAQLYSLSSLTAGGGYLTGSSAASSIHCSVFEVLEEIPFRLKKIQERLRAQGIGQIEVKTRGVPENTDKLQKQLRRKQGKPGTLFLFRRGSQTVAVIDVDCRTLTSSLRHPIMTPANWAKWHR